MWQRRGLYAIEALVILLMTLMGGVFLGAFTVVALVSLPALVIAAVAVIKPQTLEPREPTDLQGGRRRYLHICAVLCAAGVLCELVWLIATTR
jgi:hypothetical protein